MVSRNVCGAIMPKRPPPKCKACEGTGVSSRGGVCFPCKGKGKLDLARLKQAQEDRERIQRWGRKSK